MIVTIETENGHMEVDLEEFFPTSLSRTRKLFRLMQQGMSGCQLDDVRNYLKKRGDLKNIAAKRKLEESGVQQAEERLEEIKRERNKLEHQRRFIRDRIRRLEQEEKAAPTWVREFDYICGDLKE